MKKNCNLILRMTKRFICCFKEPSGVDIKQYRKLWSYSVILIILMTLTPVVMVASIDLYHSTEYNRKLNSITEQLITNQVSYAKKSAESFLNQNLSLLRYIIRNQPFEELREPERLSFILNDLKKTFSSFTTLELFSSKGTLLAYAGSQSVKLKANYSERKWFHKVSSKGIYISDLSEDFKHSPNLTISVKSGQRKGGDFYVLKSTLEADRLSELIHNNDFDDRSDVFLVNQVGRLQTSSHFFGNASTQCPLKVFPFSRSSGVLKTSNPEGHPLIVSYSYIGKFPFYAVVVKKQERKRSIQGWFFLESRWLMFFGTSMLFVLLLAMGTSTYLVSRIRKADLERIAVLQNIELEHTNKLASIGRLSAGIAHEINNPLAIIQEKAGLMKDIITASEGLLQKEKQKEEFLSLIESIKKSINRCSTITHHLLGFARQVDVTIETVDLNAIIKDVLLFFEREAKNKNITINLILPDKPSLIKSDRGQLEQVFLNLASNACGAVKDGGQIDFSVEEKWERNQATDAMHFRSDSFEVTVSDNGKGIAEEHLEQIFEPFFTNRKKHGTGLGLAITYGIVKKLGGSIQVNSKLGRGTTFTVTLPKKR